MFNPRSRIVSLSLAALSLLSLTTLASAQSNNSPLENLPYSGGVLMARAIRAGRVQLSGGPLFWPELPPAETCSPVPCVLPNVDVFPTPYAVNETPVVVNPKNGKQLLIWRDDASPPLSTLQQCV